MSRTQQARLHCFSTDCTRKIIGKKMDSRAFSFVAQITTLLIAVSIVNGDECQTYAGGAVYPRETGKSSGHSLQWTKAMSPTEILAFNDRIEEFRALNTELVACSVDSHFTHLAWVNTPKREGGLGPLKIPLLSDLSHKISTDYGVYLEDIGHTLRGLFIIDDKQTLRQITMNDLPVGRSVDETLRLVQAFQYTDHHGEVCPAGWKPGSDTIIPHPEEKKLYFEKQKDEI
ncbi:peroxiredoxin-4 isoform X4 [Daphnia magna]|uniref:peroxiredoxin-4 isoform X4 n=1 Tax=Daphnia magna TaxID=35525 RepID=UPI001E1BC2CC|nr:peroxiredoxin-4 isoform X4 [Daphnia magna]